MRIENVVLSVAGLRQAEPAKTIVVTDVDETVFTGAFWDRAFRALGIDEVYVDPDSAEKLPFDAWRAAPAEFSLDRAIIRRLIDRDQLLVLSAAGEPPLHQVTRAYVRRFLASHPGSETPRRIEAASAVTSDLFGDSWHPPEHGFRWMPGRATVRIGGPTAAGQRLHLTGHNPPEQARAGPVKLRIQVEDLTVGEATLSQEGGFSLSYPLPASFQGRPSIRIILEVSRTFRPPCDGRELSLVFTIFEVR
jgi:hypothetical protein